MIDLHTHTTASDGRCSPAELVARAVSAGVDVLAVTDHDTFGGCAPVAAECARAGIEFVPGIEITAVVDEADVHVLGYFVDPESEFLRVFLDEQRRRRVDRLREMLEVLEKHGISLDADAILQPAVTDRSKSVGRPWIGRALVAGGYVADLSEAFDRWLSYGRPAFVPRVAAGPEEVFVRIHQAGGLASLAHPAKMAHDERLPAYVEAKLDAIEAYHPDHDSTATARYLALAYKLNVGVTGGSDFHGEDGHGGGPGSVFLPRPAFNRLLTLRFARA